MRRVTDRRHLLRLELAVCALGVTVLLTTLVIGTDALRFHRATLGESWFSPVSVPLSVILAFECLALVLMGVSLVRQIVRQRTFVSRLPTESRTILGVPVLVIASRRPHAFCVGFLRPRIVVSDGLLDLLSENELLCVIVHEAHHARRRDPLRRALVKATCDGFWFVPGMRSTAMTYATISELAADAVAIRKAGSGSLASALVQFEDHGGDQQGATAERVSHLLGVSARRSASALSMALAAVVLLALAGGLLYLLRPVPTELCLPLSTALGAPLAVFVFGVACVPAGFLGRRAARSLRAPVPPELV
jgi:Zn-dependent protease with chaperone function